MKVVAALTVKQVTACTKQGRAAVWEVRGLNLFASGNSRIFVYRHKSLERGKMTTASVGAAADITLKLVPDLVCSG